MLTSIINQDSPFSTVWVTITQNCPMMQIWRNGHVGSCKAWWESPCKAFFFFDFQSCLTIHPLTRLCQTPPPNIVMPKIHPSCKLCVRLVIAMAVHGGNSSRLYYVFVFSQLQCMIARVFVHWYSDEWFHWSKQMVSNCFCDCFCVSNHLFCQKRARISSSPLLSVCVITFATIEIV